MSRRTFAQSASLLLLLITSIPVSAAEPGFARALTVAADGSGDFTTIQSAIDTIPRNNRERILIEIGAGVYPEKVLHAKVLFTFRGQSEKGTEVNFYAPRDNYARRYDS